MEDYLKARGVPESFIAAEPSALPQELFEKFTTWKQIVNRDLPVTIVTGTKTAKKMELIACLVKEFVALKKSVYMFYPGASLEIPNSFLYAIVGLDMIPQGMVEYMRSILFNHVIYGNSPLILECESLKSLESVIGKPFIDAVSEKMIEVNTGIVKTPHTVL